jgi:Ulp1 family protease
MKILRKNNKFSITNQTTSDFNTFFYQNITEKDLVGKDLVATKYVK